MQRLAQYLCLFMRTYLGAFYLASGLNFFFLVWPQPIPVDPLGAAYMSATLNLGLFQFAKVLEACGGFLLLTDLWVPLALVLLMPVAVTIFVMNTFFSPLAHVAVSGARNFGFHCVLLLAYSGYYRQMLVPAARLYPLWSRGRPQTEPAESAGCGAARSIPTSADAGVRNA